MDESRAIKLLQQALCWIYEHTEGYGEDEYVRALRHIGMSEQEIQEQLSRL